MVICTGWTDFKVASVETALSCPLFPPGSSSFKSGLCEVSSPWSPWSNSWAGAAGPQRWALWSFIFNCTQKYIYIKNVEQCLFNSDIVYILLNLCLGGQLTRNHLSIRFRSLYAPWLARSAAHFKHVCYSLWFPSSVMSHQAGPNYSIKKICRITRIKHE